jgi:hypothetical protein
MGRQTDGAGEQPRRNLTSYMHCRKSFDIKSREYTGCDAYFTEDSNISQTCPFCGKPLAHTALEEPPEIVHRIPALDCVGGKEPCKNTFVCPPCFGDERQRKPQNCRVCVCGECCGVFMRRAQAYAEMLKKSGADAFEYILRQRKLPEAG